MKVAPNALGVGNRPTMLCMFVVVRGAAVGLSPTKIRDKKGRR